MHTPTTPEAQQVLRPNTHGHLGARALVVVAASDTHRKLERVALLEAPDLAHTRGVIGHAVPAEGHLPCRDTSHSLRGLLSLDVNIWPRGAVLHRAAAVDHPMTLVHHAKL